MSDLISRQAAIDAVNTALFPKILSARDAEKALRRVPLAQPELIRCKDCTDYQTDWETSYPNRHYCATMDAMMPEDGFCSNAERREG